MPRTERRSAQPARSLARTGSSRAREAHQRGRQAAIRGAPRRRRPLIRAGLRELGWAEDGITPDPRQVHEAHQPWRPGC